MVVWICLDQLRVMRICIERGRHKWRRFLTEVPNPLQFLSVLEERLCASRMLRRCEALQVWRMRFIYFPIWFFSIHITVASGSFLLARTMWRQRANWAAAHWGGFMAVWHTERLCGEPENVAAEWCACRTVQIHGGIDAFLLLPPIAKPNAHHFFVHI